jgi:hypothetical protein
VDKIEKESKSKKTGNVVQNCNSWGFTKIRSRGWQTGIRITSEYSVTTRIRQSVYNPLGNVVGARLLVSYMRRWKDKQLWAKTLRTKH